ncbi:MAG: hypothetical protein Q9157_003781 [Trypethelium eluteriae]
MAAEEEIEAYEKNVNDTTQKQKGIAALERESDDLDTSDSICQPVHRRIRIGEPSHKYDHKSEDENSRMLHQPEAERPRHTILSDIEAKLLENDIDVSLQKSPSVVQWIISHASPILVLFMCASTALIITYYAKKYPQERRGYFLCAAAMSAFMTIEFSTPETHFLERVL